MKTIRKNIFITTFSIAIIAIVAFYHIDSSFAKETGVIDAKASCVGSSGNLYGYIDTENAGPVYVSKKSWNDTHPNETTDVEFYTEVNRSNPTNLTWSGKGWNETVGWVDFSYDQLNDIVRFEEPGTEHDGGCDDGGCEVWGGWNGEADLSALVYSTETGTISGQGVDKHNDTGGEENDTEDDYIGSGIWTFDHLEFQEPPCPQNVNLFINGKNSWYKKECPAVLKDVPLQWVTENVHDCKSLESPDFWINGDQNRQNTGTSITANGTITEDNAPIIFKLRCIGDSSGTQVDDIVVASCGKFVPPASDIDIISPILIEA